jgi:23S rRNA (adenine2030-N6)-methyltransferase
MLSYRHAYHAGNHADVLKHLVLVHVLNALQRKPAAICYIDTHAGAGSYDLRAAEAEKLGEHRQGVARLWGATAAPFEVTRYLAAIRALNAKRPAELRFYPGSPALAIALLRPADRCVLIERHPTDHALLARRYGDAANVRVELGDGFELLKGFVPPHEKRGVVFLDPSYELKHEYREVVDCVSDAHRRWATGTYLVWYPLLAR